jgi:aspartokinase-like uncharacterized kinase
MSRSLAVVKVGGSLYDLSGLGPRLQSWLEQAPSADVLLVPGGGPTAEAVRDLDRIHQLGEEKAHWLALHALHLNAHFLTRLLPEAEIVHDPEGAAGPVRVLDAFAFLSRQNDGPNRLPHYWAVTSDSIAARAAVVFGASHLILLKSVTIPEGMDWEEAAEHGFVDEWFARTLRPAGAALRVRAVNFREWKP